jgi:hypothetical protein
MKEIRGDKNAFHTSVEITNKGKDSNGRGIKNPIIMFLLKEILSLINF